MVKTITIKTTTTKMAMLIIACVSRARVLTDSIMS